MDWLDKNTDNKSPDMGGLREFVRRSDRGRPLHFVGRKQEFKRLQTALDSTVKAADAADGSAYGKSQLITAAPGAGKSALLEELKDRWEADKIARVARLRVAWLGDPVEAFQELVLQLEPKAAERFGVTTVEGDTTGLNYGLQATQHKGAQRTQEWPRSMGAVVRWLRSEAGDADQVLPLILVVDEVQNLKLAGPNASAPLRDVHEGIQGYPVMLVLAGLGDSIEVLQECGISRLERGSQVPLGGLPPEDLHEAVEKFLSHFHVRGSSAERRMWAQAMAEDACGWPQHLASGLCAAAEAIIKGHGDLAQASLEAALAHASADRRTYYDRQTKPFQRMPELLASVFTAMPGNTAAAKIEDAIDAVYETHPKLNGRMEKGRVFTTLLRQGMLQDFGHNHYDCPIPSLRTYVEEFCAQSGCPCGAAAAEAAAPPRLRRYPATWICKGYRLRAADSVLPASLDAKIGQHLKAAARRTRGKAPKVEAKPKVRLDGGVSEVPDPSP